ncbi:MAG: efflux RND transporter periplasmic adaptor subunit [Thermoanaerobaculia bacterium]|nr:efflux RND transporter periplasmic adaptor subunit [Thermoanaerobaculia bacterium]
MTFMISRRTDRRRLLLLALLTGGLILGCGGDTGSEGQGGRAAGAPGRGGPGGAGFGGEKTAAVPVEVATVEEGRIASTLSTHGTLEAEAEVDLVSRIAGPIVELRAEEGMEVRSGQLLARIDPREVAAQLEVSRVKLAEAQNDFDRTQRLLDSNLVSRELYDSSASALDSARAEHARNEIQVGYTEIKAPFSGLIVRRYIKDAENISTNQALFRLSDFDPLLCSIRVPERELPRLQVGQLASLTVEAYGSKSFEARVIRISPVVEAESGTVKVTLEAAPQGQLRPGMFASVALELEAREGALIIPKVALSLDSIGDTVFVAKDGAAERREITVGFRDGQRLEVLEGLQRGEEVVVLGQDGLADGTPIQVLSASGEIVGTPAQSATSGDEGRGGSGPPRFEGGEMTPEQLEAIKERMRSRGLSEAQIEERLKNLREGGGPPGRSR